MTGAVTVLINFDGTDGASPKGSLITDSQGDLFGTTMSGGSFNSGTTFEIAKTAGGYASTPTTIGAFYQANFNPYQPAGDLTADANGDLFGTAGGGISPGLVSTDWPGAVFEIARTAGGYASTTTNLAGFDYLLDQGGNPGGSLILDANGDLFGTASQGGPGGYGTVFELETAATGYASALDVLVSFDGTNGAGPSGSLIADAGGDLFGTTVNGGLDNEGTVFEVEKLHGGYVSSPVTLANFDGTHGAGPSGSLIADANGDLFGTTATGGTHNDGTVFEIEKAAGGYISTPITLINFNGANGANPYGSLLVDKYGDLFGTTESGGTDRHGTDTSGTVFEIAKTAGGYAAAPTTLLNLLSTLGTNPYGSLTADAAGNLFATTSAGGANNDGTVIELSGDFVPPSGVFVWAGNYDSNVALASNWNEPADSGYPASVAPGLADTAIFAGGAANVTGTISVSELDIAGEDVVLLTSAADFSASGDIMAGTTSSAAISVRDGSTLLGADVMVAGSSAGSGSSIDVAGPGSMLEVTGSLVVGGAGEGSLSVAQGAAVSAASVDEASAAGGGGVITVAGPGSRLSLTGSFTIGDQAAGEVSILGGATVSALDVTIGNAAAASSGNVDVEGSGSSLLIGSGGVLNVGVAGGGSGELTIGVGTTLHSLAGIVEAGRASFNNNGGVVDPPFVDFTGPSNAGLGSNSYDLYVENIGAVQLIGGTGVWTTPMMLTGTSVADASNNINVNGDAGAWQLSSGGTLIVNANTVDSGQAVVFEDATDTLVIGQIVNNGSAGVSGTPPMVNAGAENVMQAGGWAATIWGYVAGDKIQFANMAVSSASVVNGNTVDLFGPANVSLGSLAFFNKAGSKASPAGASAAAAQIPCFAAGTCIETADGPVRIEDLRVGDRMVTADGGNEPIVWIGSRMVNCRAHPQPETVWPVRIAAGAFAENVPVRDLFLSPDHAVFVNGVLVPVKLLIDGTGIAPAKRDRVVYHHIELAVHAVILAEALPVESYLDTGDRANFDDRATIRLFPDFTRRPTSPSLWESKGVAPLVTTGPELAAARLKIAATRYPIGLAI